MKTHQQKSDERRDLSKRTLAPIKRMTEAEAEEMGIVGFELDTPLSPEEQGIPCHYCDGWAVGWGFLNEAVCAACAKTRYPSNAAKIIGAIEEEDGSSCHRSDESLQFGDESPPGYEDPREMDPEYGPDPSDVVSYYPGDQADFEVAEAAAEAFKIEQAAEKAAESAAGITEKVTLIEGPRSRPMAW